MRSGRGSALPDVHTRSSCCRGNLIGVILLPPLLMRSHILIAALVLGAAACHRPSMRAHITRTAFGTTADGTAVDLFTLTNARGVEVRAMTYGATIVSLRTPDRGGQLGDIVLGYPTLAGYLAQSPYFGAIVGRYGNRIAKGRFSLDGKAYQLATNNGPNHLHGGVKGFDKVVWSAEPARRSTRAPSTHASPTRSPIATSCGWIISRPPTKRRRSTSRSTAISTWRERARATSSATS